MSEILTSDQAQAALAYAQKKATSTYKAGNKIGITMMLCVVAGCTVLPFLQGKKDDVTLTVSALYIAATLLMAVIWMVLGYLNEKRATCRTANPTFQAHRWGTPLELSIFYLLFIPIIFFIIFWGSSKLGYFGFNYSLLFVAVAFCALATPPWLTGLTIVFQIFCFSFIGNHFFNWTVDIADNIGIGFGLSFTAMMIFFWKNESLMRTASEILVKELETANEKLRAFSLNAEELATTQERNRIAREIHDTLGHSLTVVNIQLEAAEALIETDKSKARRFINKAREIAQEGLQGVRASVSSLRSSPLDGKTLVESLREMIAPSQANGIEISLKIEGQERPLDWQTESALFRTAQEALTNARKHSQAKNIHITLNFQNDSHIQLVITDDGIGCEKAEGGFGLLGIRERAHYLQGKSEIKTSTGQGFRLEIALPYERSD